MPGGQSANYPSYSSHKYLNHPHNFNHAASLHERDPRISFVPIRSYARPSQIHQSLGPHIVGHQVAGAQRVVHQDRTNYAASPSNAGNRHVAVQFIAGTHGIGHHDIAHHQRSHHQIVDQYARAHHTSVGHHNRAPSVRHHDVAHHPGVTHHDVAHQPSGCVNSHGYVVPCRV